MKEDDCGAMLHDKTQNWVRSFVEDAREHDVTRAVLDKAHRVDRDGEDEAAAANGRRKNTVAFPVLLLGEEEMEVRNGFRGSRRY